MILGWSLWSIQTVDMTMWRVCKLIYNKKWLQLGKKYYSLLFTKVLGNKWNELVKNDYGSIRLWEDIFYQKSIVYKSRISRVFTKN